MSKTKQKEILYPVSALHKRNSKGRDIIIIPIKEFSLNYNPSLPSMKTFSNYPTSIYHNDYFIRHNGFKQLPYHYLVHIVNNRWDISVASPLSNRSHLLESAAFNGLIPEYLQDSIVIAVQDDFHVTNPDDDMWRIVGNKLIQPLFYMMNKRSDIKNSIHFFDEIFDFDRYKIYFENNIEKLFGRISNNNYPYQASKNPLFDRIIMDKWFKESL